MDRVSQLASIQNKALQLFTKKIMIMVILSKLTD